MTCALETVKTVKLDVHAQTEEEAIQTATPWAHDIAKDVDAPPQIGRVLCVEKIATYPSARGVDRNAALRRLLLSDKPCTMSPF